MRSQRWSFAAAVAASLAVATAAARAQVTTAAIAGKVTVRGGDALAGVQIVAVHRPSGTTYRATTREDGRYTIAGMRVGGPYQVTARRLGYAPEVRDNVFLDLGTQAQLDLALSATATQLSAVVVQATTETTAPSRTGAATAVPRQALATLPTINRTINDFTRLTPQASGNGSFAGQDNRLNNITVDGSFFNNSFGLQGQPGARTGVAPLPLDAIDQIQVNVAPFDVRQGNFVGAGVNAVTRSGTNNWEGSVYRIARNQRFVGTQAGANSFARGTFDFAQTGARLSGPILRDRLFFFANYEGDKLTQPGTTFQANTGSQTVGGSVTRVQAADLDRLSQFLAQKFSYQTGPYQGYSFETPSTRFVTKLDFNANDANKFSLRYTFLNSTADQPNSNSGSLGAGARQGTTNALTFANSGYAIGENIRSLVGEWNGQYGGRFSNNLIAGYTKNDESRKYKSSTLFPLVDILNSGTTYTSFGFEPFTPSNQLRYRTYQLQDNVSVYLTKHELTFGGTFENYRSENVFFPGAQSVYVYNSLDDFFTDANDYLANPTRTTSPVTLNKFQVRYMNVPGLSEPIQPLQVNSYGAYAQDKWTPTQRLQLTAGVRVDLPVFKPTGYTNPQANALTFQDEHGNPVQYQTQKLPGATPLLSPRVGFNWDARGDRSTVVRGGTGIFTGRPAYVWISNQIGQNGILTGFKQATNTKAYPFNPSPDAYKPTTVTGEPAASYELDFTDRNFRFPQTWRSSVAVDQKLPFGFRGTLEYLFGRDVNGIYYINANLPAAQTKFSGVDQRARWTSNAINKQITPGAFVLKNENVGHNYNVAASLEKSFTNGLFAKAAYSYGVAKNTIDPGSIATGTWQNNATPNDPNNPGLGYSATSPGHRYFVALSYRREYLKLGATTLSFFGEGRRQGNASYTYAGDLNGDGASGNDLLYVPRNTAEMNFAPVVDAKTSAVLFTPQQQADAFEAYIQQDRYLRAHRGEYAQRNAAFLPMVFRADASLAQDIFRSVGGKRNTLQVRLDVFNVGNLLNKNWGVGDRFVNYNANVGANQPLVAAGADATGAARYQLQRINGALVTSSLQKSSLISDVYRMQLGLRYTFQ